MVVKSGLDTLRNDSYAKLRGKAVGVVCNQASVAGDRRHILELFHDASLEVRAVFGPQHGLWGHTQDNMIEWEGYIDSLTGYRIYSLYGETRKPSRQQLEGIDMLVVDLQDVGARYYTFIWTMALCLESCAELGVPVMVLDRPNPIGGMQVEGPVMLPEFSSFVGLHPLPARHGLTIGEIATLLSVRHYPSVDLQIIPMQGWKRWMYFDDNGLPWVMPSPNMPCLDTAIVYPGACLLEGTTVSEGRGTTRPFEIFGSPEIDGRAFCRELNNSGLKGMFASPFAFQPTFQKHAGKLCEGAFLHVTDRSTFEPVLTYVTAMSTIKRLFPNALDWKHPPYEYETVKRPIDILAGNAWLAPLIEEGANLENLRERLNVNGTDLTAFHLYGVK